ncbi:MAG: AfsR/SARP family transcriptional regulator [Longimicrobiales bacterium]
MIELRTLGALELISAEGTPIRSVLAQSRRMALLCYLALTRPSGFQSRDTLYALFWPEHDTAQGRHALRQSLYVLRRELGANAIVSRGDGALGLATDHVLCDAWEFERAVDEELFEKALALYRGDSLAGFHVSDSVAFEHWLDAERTRLRERAAEATWTFSEALAQAGQAAWAGNGRGVQPRSRLLTRPRSAA